MSLLWGRAEPWAALCFVLDGCSQVGKRNKEKSQDEEELGAHHFLKMLPLQLVLGKFQRFKGES